MRAEEVAKALHGKRTGTGYVARCPVPGHEDSTPSLTLNDGDGGKLLWNCKAGCTQEAVAQALRERGLLNGHNRAVEFTISELGAPSHVWTYRDAAGSVLMRVARYDTAKGKECRPWRLEGGRWICKALPEPRPLYGLDLLAQRPTDPVLIAEGEKAADAGRQLVGSRYVVVTWPGGAKSVAKADFRPLARRSVVIWPDADAAGLSAAQAIVSRLRDTAASVAILDVTDRPSGWDAADALAEGWTADETLTFVDEHAHVATGTEGETTEEQKEAVPERYRMRTISELLTTKPPRALIRGVLLERTVAVVWGQSTTGKTFVVLDMSLACGRGVRWMNRRTRQVGVLYVAGEGHLRNRIDAYVQHHGLTAEDLVGFRALSTNLNLFDPNADFLPLLRSLQLAAEEMGGVGIVVIDTLNSVMAGGDENSPQDMTRMLEVARKIKAALDCTVIYVHHGGKDESRGPRGHYCLLAGIDNELHCQDADSHRTLTVGKFRDGESGHEFAFRLRPVDLGPSDDPEAEPDERESSCVVEPLSDAIASAPKPQKRDVALDALREAISEYGEIMPGTSTIPQGVKAVTLERWQARWRMRTGDDYKDQRTCDAAFRGKRNTLQKDDKIQVWDQYVWLSR